MITWLANHIWIIACSSSSQKYHRAVKKIRETQRDVLRSIIHANQETEYGRKFHFPEIRTITDYQKYVPITEYEDYQPYISRMAAGASNVLTGEPVRIFELSSGSTAPSKLIPYTNLLKRQFGAGINPWVYNLYRSYPGLFRGKAYWSVTPINSRNSYTSGGIPIGFEEDQEYFGAFEKRLLELLFTVPGEIKRISDPDSFRYVTLLFLLKEKRLALISVWNPTFLTQLLQPLCDWRDNLLRDLEKGAINPPGKVTPEIISKLNHKLRKNPARALELQRIFALAQSHQLPAGRTVYECIWPQLTLISCWTDANAGMYIPEVQALFPTVPIQGKGLLATEGFVSLPYVGEDGARLSVRSHFFEFEELDNTGKKTGEIRCADELKTGRTYSVILTTGGGFYRYRLRDIIQVIGFAGQCPRMRFLGKESMVSDLCGEKLNEFHVRQILDRTFHTLGLRPAFAMVAPEICRGNSYYVLFLEFEVGQNPDPPLLANLAAMVETQLEENFHYQYCRKIGQLQPLKLYLIAEPLQQPSRGVEIYHQVCRELGIRDGDIKMYALHPRTGWVKAFPGFLIECKEEVES
jgi:hypothetical protein